jgi:WD40 repeat protein
VRSDVPRFRRIRAGLLSHSETRYPMLNDEQFDRAMRYALEAYPARGRLPWTTPFSTELEGKLAGGAQSIQLLRILKGHSARVMSAAFSGDDKRVVTTSWDNTARVWDAETGREIAALIGHADVVFTAAFSGDGTDALGAPLGTMSGVPRKPT